MYTKTGLGLLAAAGLTFGMIGMHAGGASPTTPPCASTSTADGAASAGGASADANGSLAPTGPVGPGGSVGQDGNGNPAGNGDQNGNPNNDGNGNDGNGTPGTTPTTQPGDGGTSGQGSLLIVDGSGRLGDTGTGPVSVGTNNPSSGADNAFLNVNGTTDGLGTGDGSTATPPANLRGVGRSAYLSRLLQLWVRANANH